VDSMWKDIAAAQAACASIDNSEIVAFLDVLENSDGILVSGMGEFVWLHSITSFMLYNDCDRLCHFRIVHKVL